MHLRSSTNNYPAANLFEALEEWDTGLSPGHRGAPREKVQSKAEPRVGGWREKGVGWGPFAPSVAEPSRTEPCKEDGVTAPVPGW